VLPAHLADDTTFQERFRRESHARAGINEPHVVPIHSYGEIDRRLYLDMRLIEGRNLGAILKESDKPLGAAFAVPLVEQVAAALDAAHDDGLIHRDVKPSNILITERDFAYLIDFGLARTAGDDGVTTAGSTLGTLAYMAPERFAVKTNVAALEPAGEVFNSAPYGWAVAKRSPLAESLRQALEHLMQTGEYRTIATMWGVEKGMIAKPVITGAIS
jgi:serine/threonine protein kinase